MEAPIGGASPGSSDYSMRCQTWLAKWKEKSGTLTAFHVRLPSCADHRAAHVNGAQSNFLILVVVVNVAAVRWSRFASPLPQRDLARLWAEGGRAARAPPLPRSCRNCRQRSRWDRLVNVHGDAIGVHTYREHAASVQLPRLSWRTPPRDRAGGPYPTGHAHGVAAHDEGQPLKVAPRSCLAPLTWI
jgi:hypothetical protein